MRGEGERDDRPPAQRQARDACAEDERDQGVGNGQDRGQEQAHEAGLAIHTWNIDDPSLLPPVIATGVDAIGSNFPDRVRGAVAGR